MWRRRGASTVVVIRNGSKTSGLCRFAAAAMPTHGAVDFVLNTGDPSGSTIRGATLTEPIMLRIAFASLLAAALVATTFAVPSDAAEHHKHVEKKQVEVVRDHAEPARYGMPANYYPAPPFPFILLPGPWWLPAHS
jgi:hypothetical protein